MIVFAFFLNLVIEPTLMCLQIFPEAVPDFVEGFNAESEFICEDYVDYYDDEP